jgi:hypothetical protein
MTERQLQDAVIELAEMLKWLVYHTYDSRRSNPGFPDLVMVRGGRLLFVELKSAKGKLRPEQHVWLNALDTCGAEVYTWRPDDWTDGSIEACLRSPA